MVKLGDAQIDRGRFRLRVVPDGDPWALGDVLQDLDGEGYAIMAVLQRGAGYIVVGDKPVDAQLLDAEPLGENPH